MSELTPNNIPEPDKSVAEIHAEAIDKATKIYAMLKEAGYTAEDLAVTDFLINPHKPPHLCHPAPPPCPPPPKPPKCEVAEYTAPRPIVHPHAPHKDHEHNMMPPCPMPEKPMPICPPPFPLMPCPPKPQGAFPPYAPNGGCVGGIKPPMPNGGSAQRVAQADWNEQNPFSASYIANKPNVVLEINGVKPDPETGKLELEPEDLQMEALSNEELSGIINDVFHIFETEKPSICSCGCNA